MYLNLFTLCDTDNFTVWHHWVHFNSKDKDDFWNLYFTIILFNTTTPTKTTRNTTTTVIINIIIIVRRTWSGGGLVSSQD